MASSSRIPDEYLNTWGAINNYTPNAFQGTSISRDANSRPVKKLNSACDLCRQSRVKCSGGFSCRRCEDNNLKCKYSISRRCGRVKAALGSRQHKLRSPRLPPRNGTSQDMGMQIAPLCEALNVPSNLDIISQDGPSLALDFAGDFNEYGFSFPDDQFGFEGLDWPMNGIASNGFSHPFSNRVSVRYCPPIGPVCM
ncbi:hypothetical protein B0J14DRAFT_574891 [Halenospora varia]|nr:hypothetical protein B0J14DRAFT_574891 [Halenospora varia]